MKLYRVTKRDPISKTKSYQYFTAVGEAVVVQRGHNRMIGRDDDVSEVDFELSKKGICKLLNELTNTDYNY